MTRPVSPASTPRAPRPPSVAGRTETGGHPPDLNVVGRHAPWKAPERRPSKRPPEPIVLLAVVLAIAVGVLTVLSAGVDRLLGIITRAMTT